jgi:hypothetical protein
MVKATAIAVAVAALSICGRASATAIVVCASDKGVIVSADSKANASDGTKLPKVDKIVQIGNRTVVALSGVAYRREIDFDYQRWIRKLGRKLGANPTPSELAEAVRAASEAAFKGHGDLLVLPGMAPGSDFVVAGIDPDGLAVWLVTLRPDGKEVHAEKQRKFAAGAGAPESISGYGFPNELGFGDTSSSLWQAVRTRIPDSYHGKIPTLDADHRASLCGLSIAVAAERWNQIALPIEQAIVTTEKGITRETWTPPQELR